MGYNYMVNVRCMTYNHAPYIVEAMNGFCIQQTSFPFVCTIIDDCSTDGEQDIIERFLCENFDLEDNDTHRIEETNDYILHVARHKFNRNCEFVVLFLKYNHYSKRLPKNKYIIEWSNNSKYTAVCEGDDYWNYSFKLQKQVDFLESHLDYSMCCSDARIKTSLGEYDWHRYDLDCEIPIKDLILGGGLFIQTCTFCYRRDLKTMPSCCLKCHVGDYPLQIWAALNGKVYYFADKMATYNLGVPGSWSSRQKKLPIKDVAKGWKSEVDMLQGLDNYSEGKFHDFFKQRTIKYVYNIMINHIDEWHSIWASFDYVINEFGFSQRIVEKLARFRFPNMAMALAHIFVGEYKSGIVTLPLVNNMYNYWKN